MDAFHSGIPNHGQGISNYHREQPDAVGDTESMDSDRQNIYLANDNPHQIVTFAPKERFRLGYFDVICLVLNRMIGTGIFESPQRVIRGTRSTGVSLLLWFGGVIYCLCGAHVYIEYGLNIPRYTIDGVEQSVPRSGGDLNYLQYVYPWPALRRNTVLLSACIFGAGFIAFGNMASNCISFATRLLLAADIESPSNGTVRGIAIGIAILACFIHAFSRRGGIWLNNVLAVIKVLMLLLIIVTAIIMVVVPKDSQVHGEDGVAQQFFELSLGGIGSSNVGKRIFNAFLAVSSVGNIIVMTYTAARVKQEIAKEGILPAAKFFAQNTDMSLGRVLRWLQRKGWLAPILRYRWLSPEEHSEKTPVGAFVLHLIACFVLIFATWGLSAGGTYYLVSNLNSYVINGIFGVLLGMGILILRFRGPPAPDAGDASHASHPAPRKTWGETTGKRFNPIVSVTCAVIYIIGNLWPVVASWVKPEADFTHKYKWWIMPTICWAVICLGAAWFLCFMAIAFNIGRKQHKVYVVEKKPEFESAYGGDGPVSHEDAKAGGLVMVHETVYLSWVGRETLRARQPHGEIDGDEFDDRTA
ncbi:hypothetical protein K4F52_009483 [Lecanicillium sp. MT-2017a]|nr:hypothetical protein K4F52_009483 [Lecanicillium sp. MT-2017a]